uniref:Uncharacterized protein n=1 Tax=Panthera tigris altaica TaxID=74533 RepID=A0A8C9JF21_PANTA
MRHAGSWKLWLWMAMLLLPASTSVTVRDKSGIQATSFVQSPNVIYSLQVIFKTHRSKLLGLRRP